MRWHLNRAGVNMRVTPFPENVTGIDIVPGEWQYRRPAAAIGSGEVVAQRARANRPLRTSVRVVALAERSSKAFLCTSGAIDSRVATKRVPINTPLAPSARVLTNPRPSASPPAAMTGMRRASTTSGTSATVPTVPISPETGLTKCERCPPASAPCATTASKPVASTSRASSTVVTMAITFVPWRWHASTISAPGFPRPTLKTGTRSSRIT
jgi:hypothetical protein